MSGLANTAMLVQLSISKWLDIIVDREVTEKTAADYSAISRMVSVRKTLINRRGAAARLQAALRNLRNYHITMTLPWEKGIGIIKSTKYSEYSTKMRQLISEAKLALNDFVVEFPELKKEAKQDLGTMYKDSDYPDVSNLKGKYNISINVKPIPAEGDWRVDLPVKEMQEIEESRKQQEENNTKKAMEKLWHRVYAPIKHIVEVLNKDNPKIYKTLLSNISDLVDLLPDLNIVEDPKLIKLGQEIQDKLCDIDLDELKQSKFFREAIAETAEGIRKKVKNDGNISEDDEVLEIMSGYASNKVIDELGTPVVGQRNMFSGKKEKKE